MLNCKDCRYYYSADTNSVNTVFVTVEECRRNPPVAMDGALGILPHQEFSSVSISGEWQPSAAKEKKDRDSMQRLIERDEQNRDGIRQAVREDLGF